jgi:glycosyltransferase involved in cell wall biosynthesis
LLGSRNDVRDLLAVADALVSPTRYDSYGLSVHEAICRGTPAIVSAAAGVSERYPPALRDLVLDDPEDHARLAEAIGVALSERARFQPEIDAWGATLREWTWDKMADQIASLAEAVR